MASGWLTDATVRASVYRALIGAGASTDAAADALQDAYVDALELDVAPLSPGGWLFVTALRRWKRTRWRGRLFRPLAAARSVGTPDQFNVDALDAVAAVRRLPTRQREVIVARYLLGLSQAETAELLGIAPGTVAATTHQATARLRTWLQIHDE
jgi:RNA polymerase sigma factor (sigma-70 family)